MQHQIKQTMKGESKTSRRIKMKIEIKNNTK